MLGEEVFGIDNGFAGVGGGFTGCREVLRNFGGHDQRSTTGGGDGRNKLGEGGEVGDAEGTPVATVI